MRAETPSINGVFKNSTVLRIPFFQRQYVWGEKEWQRFVNDMESLVDLRNKYFLGSLIFKNEEPTDEEAAYGVSEKYIVIDGQQRLTTLSIYLKALDSLLTDDQLHNNFQSSFFIQNGQRNPVLHHSINDRAAYQEVMWGYSLDAYVEKRVVKAYHFFHNKFLGKSQSELRKLWMAVFARIKSVEIILDDQDDEQQIFDTINSLGVDLTIDELMKNFLYDAEEEQAYVNNWKPMFDDAASREFWGTSDAARSQAATDENKVISNFFYDFVRIKMWDYEDEEGFDRKVFVQKSQTFSTCKSFVEIFNTGKQSLANEIIEYAKLYKKYFNKRNLDIRLPTTPGIERVACIAMAKDSTITPYLLYVLKNIPDLKERNRMFGFLETYLVRRMVALPVSANKMSAEFFTEQLIGKRIDSFDNLKQYIMDINEDKNMHMPSDEEIATNIHKTVFGDESIPRLIYYLQETRNGYNKSTGGFNYFLAEYIIPKPCKASEINYPPHEDDMKEQERKTRTKTIGNFILLKKPRIDDNPDRESDEQEKMKKDLKKVANESFAVKSEVMKKYLSPVVCSDWFARRRSWNEDDVQTRNNLIVTNLVPKIWPL